MYATKAIVPAADSVLRHYPAAQAYYDQPDPMPMWVNGALLAFALWLIYFPSDMVRMSDYETQQWKSDSNFRAKMKDLIQTGADKFNKPAMLLDSDGTVVYKSK